jgi:hypothetical protein
MCPYCASSYQPPPPLPGYIDKEFEWEVDCISNVEGSGRTLQCFVHWRGFPEVQWEPAANVMNAPEKIREFWEFQGQPCSHPLNPDPNTPDK